MQANDLLQALEDRELEILNNQAVADTMVGGIESGAVFGAMDSNVIADNLVTSMPDPSEDALNMYSMDSPLPDFTPPSDDAPGLG